MRALFGIIVMALAVHVVGAVDVRDLGVPAGLRADDYDERGFKLMNKGDHETARKYFTAAIRIEPDRWGAYYNRAMTFAEQKNWAAALQDLNSTIHYKPSFLQASLDRARINKRLGNYNASLRDLDVVARLAHKVGNYAEYSATLNNRAWLRAVCPDGSARNGELAVADAKKACELSKWKVGGYVDTLAAAYAEAGDFDSAIRYQEQAITLRNSEPEETSKIMAKRKFNKVLAGKIADETVKEVKKTGPEYAQRLQLYKNHRPYRGTGDW